MKRLLHMQEPVQSDPIHSQHNVKVEEFLPMICSSEHVSSGLWHGRGTEYRVCTHVKCRVGGVWNSFDLVHGPKVLLYF